jgi:hypothetical protein
VLGGEVQVHPRQRIADRATSVRPRATAPGRARC